MGSSIDPAAANERPSIDETGARLSGLLGRTADRIDLDRAAPDAKFDNS
jgi:hypothetical protein